MFREYSPQLKLPSPLTQIRLPFLDTYGVTLWIKRDDQIHSIISGNKWRKIKLHFEKAISQKRQVIATMGGVNSNHLAATAFYAYQLGMPFFAFVRGKEHSNTLTNTMRLLQQCDAKIQFVDRQEFRKIRNQTPNSLLPNNAYWIPEGGTHILALEGMNSLINELKTQLPQKPDRIIVGVGSGGTALGLALSGYTKIEACLAVKDQTIINRLNHILNQNQRTDLQNLPITWHFEAAKKGFASGEIEILEAIAKFYNETNILLDPIYTAKTWLYLKENIEKGIYQSGEQIVFVHTGGIQGLESWIDRYYPNHHLSKVIKGVLT